MRSRTKVLLWTFSLIGLLSTGYFFFLSYAIWKNHDQFVWAHWFLFALILGLDVSCIGLWRINQRPEECAVTVSTERGTRGGLGPLFIFVASVSGAVLSLMGAVGGLALWADWSAERHAREFCDEVQIGSDISEAAARAEKIKIIWGASQGYYHNAPVGAGSPYAFYFFGFVMNVAVCYVSFNRDGKVTAKRSEMEYD